MSAPLYSYSPRPREMVAVSASEGAEEACTLSVQEACAGMVFMTVPDDAVPAVARGIVAAMHESTGLVAPLVLDRVPERAFAGWFEIADGEVLIDPDRPLSFADARRFAAALAAAVEHAEREPDPASVQALAGITREALHAVWEQGETAYGVPERVARDILARYSLTERADG